MRTVRALLAIAALVAANAFAQVGGPVIGQGGSSGTANINGGTIDNAVIGGTTPAAGTFSSLGLFGAASATSVTTTASGGATNIDFIFQPKGSTGRTRFISGGSTAIGLSLYGPSTQDGLRFITNGGGSGGQIDATDSGESALTPLTLNGSIINLQAGGTTRWQINASGHLLGFADNTYDIGATGATRPRTGYFGTSVITPAVTSSASTLPITGLAAAAGGSVSIVGGAGGTTTGGTVAITGGAATSGAGADITITAGAAAGGTNTGGSINLVPTAAVSTGTPGEVKINSARGFFETCWQQYLPASVPVTGSSYTFFMANRAYRVVAASIINSSTSTVPTVDVIKDTGTTAPGAGTSVLTGVMTFSGTANTRVSGTPSATVATTNIAAGDRLSTKWAGTVGSITGAIVCVTLVPI